MPKSVNAFTGGRSRSRKRPLVHGAARKGGSAQNLLLGMLIGTALSLAGVFLYFYLGHPPVAVSDRAALWEHLAQSTPLHRRIAAEAKLPPFPASEEGFEAAAQTYREQCSVCHGVPGRPATLGSQMAPRAPQFFGKDRKSTSAKAAGELFWPISFGVRRSGMPAFNHTLPNTQLWQLALLLHSSGDELPDPVSRLLTELPASAGTTQTIPFATSLPARKLPSDKAHLAPSERPESHF